MKNKRFLTIIILIIVIASSTALAANKWVLFHHDSNDNASYYYDKNSIKKINANIVRVNYQIVWPGAQQLLVKTRIDCKRKMWTDEGTVAYRGNKAFQKLDLERPYYWSEPISDYEFSLITAICGKQVKEKSLTPQPTK